jgi:hypothetical protein
MWRRNRWPSPLPSLAPSTRPGTSASTTSIGVPSAVSPARITPRCGVSVVNGHASTRGRRGRQRRSATTCPPTGTRPARRRRSASARAGATVRRPARPARRTAGSAGSGWRTRRCRARHARPGRDVALPVRGRGRPAPSPVSRSDDGADRDRRTGPPVGAGLVHPRTVRAVLAALVGVAVQVEQRGDVLVGLEDTSPPRPPSPPSGPPRGTWASRRNDTSRCRPPRRARGSCTRRRTRRRVHGCARWGLRGMTPAGLSAVQGRNDEGGPRGRPHTHGVCRRRRRRRRPGPRWRGPVAGLAEADVAVDEREQGVVTTAADVVAGWILVPRWRTMMPPARTTSPPYFLTPRRFALESRPLLDEPPPFLCAMVVPFVGAPARAGQMLSTVRVVRG